MYVRLCKGSCRCQPEDRDFGRRLRTVSNARLRRRVKVGLGLCSCKRPDLQRYQLPQPLTHSCQLTPASRTPNQFFLLKKQIQHLLAAPSNPSESVTAWLSTFLFEVLPVRGRSYLHKPLHSRLNPLFPPNLSLHSSHPQYS